MLSSSTQTLIVVPTYNERDTILPLLEQLLSLPLPLHILVVDDNSPDGTATLVCTRYDREPRVSVLHRPAKQGLGQAYIAGLSWGLRHGFDYLVQMDADLSHNPADVPRLVAAAARADVALGSRYIRGGATKNWPLHRRLLSQGGNLCARWMLGVGIHDLTGGFKCWPRATLEAIGLSHIGSSGYAFQMETTWRALQHGLCVREVPITFTERRAGASKMCSAIVWEAVHLLRHLRREKQILSKKAASVSV